MDRPTTFVDVPDGALRGALLQRLANDLAAMAWIDAYGAEVEWPCCWVEFSVGQQRWTHCICTAFAAPDLARCAHWHHRSERPLMA